MEFQPSASLTFIIKLRWSIWEDPQNSGLDPQIYVQGVQRIPTLDAKLYMNFSLLLNSSETLTAEYPATYVHVIE